MSHPFSSLGRRRFEPSVMQQALRTALREARRHAESLLNQGKRHPRGVALTGAAVVLTLGGAYALNASGRSMCPPPGKASATAQKDKTVPFLLLMDSVPAAAAGSALKINYDVCGLPPGTAYRGKVRLQQQQQRAVKAKKKGGSPQPKPLVLASFQDKTDGIASRKRQQVDLGAARPGAYTLELVITDNRGRARKKIQKIVLQKP